MSGIFNKQRGGELFLTSEEHSLVMSINTLFNMQGKNNNEKTFVGWSMNCETIR